jgi:hypothetical protein
MTDFTPGPPPIPVRGNGHRLPTYTDPRAGSVTPDAAALGSAVGAGVGPNVLMAVALQRGRDMAWALESALAQAETLLDPVATITRHQLRSAREGVLSALDALAQLPIRPAPGHAISGYPVPLSRGSDEPPLVAGASSPVSGPGKEPTPGSAAAFCGAACESDRLATVAGVRGPVVPDSGHVKVGTTGPASAEYPPPFSLPVTKRFLMPGAAEIAAGINEALARRSR